MCNFLSVFVDFILFRQRVISINGEEFVVFVLLNQDKHPSRVRSTRQRCNDRFGLTLTS